MTAKLLSVDGFKAAAKDGARPDCAVMRATSGEPEVVDDSRVVRFVFSDGTIDRMGDTIDPNGWELDEFAKNSVALWCHDSYAPPIGRASSVKIRKGKLIGDIEFMDAEISAFADSIFRMVKGKFLNAVSVGFAPTEWKFVNSADRPFGIDFLKQTLLEISVCAIPANPNALAEARAKGIDTAPLREWAEKLLDDGASVMVPRELLEQTFIAAKTPRATRQKYLHKVGEPVWKVGASRDLPIDSDESWDGPAAEASIFEHAGGEEIDPAKAKLGFLIYDSSNPHLKGSYKLPFARVVGGTLKAAKGGIRAAASRLEQTDAPQATLDDAKAVIDHYEEAMDMGDAGKAALELLARAGKKVSAANAAHLSAAMDHIKAVLESNEPDADDPEPPNEATSDDHVVVADPRKEAKQRLVALLN